MIIGGKGPEERFNALLESIRRNEATSVSSLHSRTADESLSIVRALEGNTSVTKLRIGGLNAEGAKVLAKVLRSKGCAISRLELQKGAFGEEGMAAIADALERNERVTILDLRFTGVGSTGVRALVRALERNSSITDLSLGDNPIDVEGARLLGAALASSTSITALYLRWNRLGDDGAIALAPGLARITKLGLSRNGMGQRGVAAIAEAIERSNIIASLDLSGNSLGTRGGQVLRRMLERCTRLTSLELRQSHIGFEGVQSVASGVAKTKSLLKLGLSWNAIGDAGAVAIAKALEGNASVAMLHLAENGITSVGAQVLATLLEKSSTLVDLDLSNNRIGEGADAVCEVLEGNTTLTALNLTSCEIADGRAIAAMLEKNGSLASLDISSNYLSANGVEAIYAALARNSSLTYVDLSEMQVGPDALARALETNRCLVSLNVNQLGFSGEGLERMLAVLRKNHVLTRFWPRLVSDSDSSEDLLERNQARRAQFVEALLRGSLDEARQFVEEGVDLHSSVRFRQSILMAVLKAGRLDSFEMLLQARFAPSLLFSMNFVGYGVPVVCVLQDELWRFPRHEGIMARLEELVGNNSCLAGMLGQLDCRYAARALYAVLRKRFKVAWCEDNPPKHIPRDMARILAQHVWQSRFAWSEHSANAVRGKQAKHQ